MTILRGEAVHELIDVSSLETVTNRLRLDDADRLAIDTEEVVSEPGVARELTNGDPQARREVHLRMILDGRSAYVSAGTKPSSTAYTPQEPVTFLF